MAVDRISQSQTGTSVHVLSMVTYGLYTRNIKANSVTIWDFFNTGFISYVMLYESYGTPWYGNNLYLQLNKAARFNYDIFNSTSMHICIIFDG